MLLLTPLALLLLLLTCARDTAAFDDLPPSGDVGGFGLNSGAPDGDIEVDSDDSEEDEGGLASGAWDHTGVTSGSSSGGGGGGEHSDIGSTTTDAQRQEMRAFVADHARGAGTPMRPAATAALTPETFDKWVEAVVETGRTAFVRWLLRPDDKASKSGDNCAWISEGYEPPDMDSAPTMPHDESAAAAFAAEDKQPFEMENPCGLAREQTQAWHTLVSHYASDKSVVFGDVVISDFPDELKAAEAHIDNTTDPESKQAQDKLDQLLVFAREVVITLTTGGCTVRHYNKQQDFRNAWAPHCADLMQKQLPSPEFDKETGEELALQEGTQPVPFLEIYVEDALTSYTYFETEDMGITREQRHDEL